MIDWFSLDHFRNIAAGRIDTGGDSVGIVGPNGSGKTSVLEALYVLAHGRSFRTAQRSSVIERSAQLSRVICSTSGTRVGAEIGPSKLKLRVDARSASLAQIASLLPIQLVDPSVHFLVEEGSHRRRRLLDWGVFHVEPRFVDAWRTYHKGLRQRNAALRAHMWAVADALGEQLVEPGEELHRLREKHFSRLLPALQETQAEVLNEAVSAEYRKGWDGASDFRSALIEARDKDRRVRQTSAGPHRADILLRVGSRLARETVSRGQQKLLASTMVLAQARYLASELGLQATLLLDDPAAELDVDNLGKLLSAVRRTPAQVIATSLTIEGLSGLQLNRMFHVKQGAIAPMI